MLVFLIDKADVGAGVTSLPVFDISDNFLLKDGARKRITIHKLKKGRISAHKAAINSIVVLCKL